MPDGEYVLPFFYGCDNYYRNDCSYTDMPAYAFWHEETVGEGDMSFEFVDLVYFFFYPYNRGKRVLSYTYYSHVGDWEHLTVRLTWQWDEQTQNWSLKPVGVYLSAHSFGSAYAWEQVPKEGTHPIAFAAKGSHGLWIDAGIHKYGQALEEDLTDHTSEGSHWDTWNLLEYFDFDEKQGLGSSTWPLWMDLEYNDHTLGDSDPASGPIWRWGNPEMEQCPFGYCWLVDGPTGPVDKDLWDDLILD